MLKEIERAKAWGVAVLLVTHNPRHAWPVGDRFVVLRHGRVAAAGERDELDVDTLEVWMAGGEAA